ncbi:hypothetical protein PhCBS80983_g01854 [Powellomyces hirtus]|uniref:Protein FRA10AC1 n=1 Tax=Powellomyces hirtus TaxID=109895 RepID=A0A507EAK8_9FUNG|nr:hypothetical protein PhCBS80983_g01854 [Powellomyces hirtus]
MSQKPTKDVSSGASTYFSLPLSLRQPKIAADVKPTNAVKDHNPLNRRDASALTAYQRHKQMMTDYVKHYQSSVAARHQPVVKTDVDVLKEKHKFLRDESDEADNSWESRVAKKYYDKLFKEYCLANLSRYRTSQIALRWRSQKEVVAGKGQFVCGNLDCSETKDLRSWEVNFAYMEDGKRKNALVKVRLCSRCSYKLNYTKIKAERQAARKRKRDERKEQADERKRQKKFGSDGFTIDTKPDTEVEVEESESEDEDRSDDEEPLEDGEAEPVKIKTSGEAYTEEEISRIWSAARPQETEEQNPTDDMDAYFADLFQ